MTINPQTDFACSIYREHLEEAAFLYEQRRVLLEDPDLAWPELASFENRLEAHLQGLILGAEAALAVIRPVLATRDEGAWYAAARGFCQMGCLDDVRVMLGKTGPRDHGMVQSLTDALAAEMPGDNPRPWLEKLAPELERLAPVALKLAGLGRLDAGPSLERLLNDKPSRELPLLIWATGRTWPRAPGMMVFPSALIGLLDHEDPRIRARAALCLMRMGCEQAVTVCRESAGAQTWPCLPLGLGGGRQDVNLLMRAALENHPADDAITALGLLGHIKAVDLLIDFLDQPGTALRAAAALHLITGAALYEKIFIAAPIDPDKLFDDESATLNQRQPPHSQGMAAKRISRDKEAWRDWWHRNQARFKPGLRFRHGKPFDIDCLLETLQAPYASCRMRRFALEELAIRYDMDLCFETDMSVNRQKKAILHHTGLLSSRKDQVEPGAWYFAGAAGF